MNLQNQIVVYVASDFKQDELKELQTPSLPLQSPDQLWDKQWLDELNDRDVIVIYRYPNRLIEVCGAAKIIDHVASKVSIGIIPYKYHDLDEEIMKARPLSPSIRHITNEDFGQMINFTDDVIIHPAQDYQNGIFYYGTALNREPYILSSKRVLTSFLECGQRNILLANMNLPENRLSQNGIIASTMGMKSISPKELHDDIVRYLMEYVYLREPMLYDLLAVWVMGTYVHSVFRYFPYLHFNAEKGSGKTILMEVLAPISFNGELLTNPSGNSIISLIARKRATLFIDESEALTSDHAGRKVDLMSILKTGFSADGKVIRPKEILSTYGPKVFAGINTIDDVLADRTITIKMSRKSETDKVELYKATEALAERQSRLRDDLYEFGITYGPSIAQAYNEADPRRPDLSHLGNRTFDIWMPLISVAGICDAGFSVIAASRSDAIMRVERESELSDIGLLLEGLFEVKTNLNPVKFEGNVCWYNPDLVNDVLTRTDALPRRMSRKALTRYLRNKLDIRSDPVRVGPMIVRLYTINWDKIVEFGFRYFPQLTSKWYKKG